MNQQGFATIFGLFLILVIALVVKGIQESEANHVYESAINFQAEIELQNAAESSIYEAADKVLSGSVTLPVNNNPYVADSRKNNQVKLISATKTSETLGSIAVEVWGERIKVKHYRKKYPSYSNEFKSEDEAYFFFGKASAKSKYMSGKIHRRATAYVLANGDATIHFMELPSVKDD